MAANLPTPPQNYEGKPLTDDQIRDALTATTRIVGTMISVLAERPGVSAELLIKSSQDAVAEFSNNAIMAARASKKEPGPV
jgi:hypothetical protein